MARKGLILNFTHGLKVQTSDSSALPAWAQPQTHLGQQFNFSHEDLLALIQIFACSSSVSAGAGPVGGLAISGLLKKCGYSFLVFTGMIAFDICFSASLGRAEERCDVREEKTEYKLKQSSPVNLEVGSPLLLLLKALEQSMGGFQLLHLDVSQ